MKLFPNSLRFQLLVWIIFPSVCVWAAAGWWVYQTTYQSASSVYDVILSSFLDSISSRVEVKDGHVALDFPAEVIPITRERHVDARYFRIRDQSGTLIGGNEDLPQLPAYPESVQIFDGVYHGQPVRIAAKRVKIPNTNLFCDLEILETTIGRRAVAEEALAKVATASGVVVLLILLKAILAVSRGLAPLEKVRKVVASLSSRSLSAGRFEVADVPDEVRPLVSTLNDLLARLHDDVAQQKRFISNAAHQLRTPIAGLKLEVELAKRALKDLAAQEALNRIENGVNRSENLIHKMLSLASAEPGAINWQLSEHCDLELMSKEIIGQFVAEAAQKNIDLGLETLNKNVVVMGQDWALRELLSNLIENALHYTPPGGIVTVSLAQADQTVIMAVEDNGPGIPEKERERVFERFYRLPDSGGVGSGLGLAIVHDIADRHDAKIKVTAGSAGKGVRFEVEFKGAV